MIYHVFERVMSSKRMKRYLNACGGNKRKAQTLYRLNLRLSQEMFTVISCYEVALRNAIDNIMSDSFGQDWLRDAIKPGGIFDNPHFAGTTRIMYKAYNELVSKCFRRWNLVSGSTCILHLSTAPQDAGYYRSSRTSPSHLQKCSITTYLSSTN